MSEPFESSEASDSTKPATSPETAETLDLPSGETVEAGEVFSFNGYPYRFFPLDHPDYRFKLAPLYWGGGDMDVPFEDREELVEQWGSDSRGTLTDEEWRDWLAGARNDDRFGEDELDAVERELFDAENGLLERTRRILGL